MIGPAELAEELRYDDRGLVPVVVQEEGSGALLMLAYANREAVELTQSTGWAHFWSRSRQELWRKGATSGNTIEVLDVLHDCDLDALLYRARAAGPACHLGTRSCFEPNPVGLELGWLQQVLRARRAAPDSASYTSRLLEAGTDRIARKVVEESGEAVIAAIRHDSRRLAGSSEEVSGSRSDLVSEAGDLLYHLLVLLESQDIGVEEIAAELTRRHASESTPSSIKPEEGPQ